MNKQMQKTLQQEEKLHLPSPSVLVPVAKMNKETLLSPLYLPATATTRKRFKVHSKTAQEEQEN